MKVLKNSVAAGEGGLMEELYPQGALQDHSPYTQHAAMNFGTP